MANKPKKGLTYFPFDTSFFTDDIKIRKLIKYQSGNAITVYVCLLCDIYKQGYYMRWDSEVPFTVSESTGLNEVFISEVIKCCLKIGLFSEQVFNDHKVLTSKGIQERYTEICNLSKRKAIVSEYMVNNTEELGIKSEELPQSKEKERKEKQKKENEIEEKIQSILNSGIWVEQTAMHFKMTVFEINECLKTFLSELKLKDDLIKPESDIKKHFINALKKNIENAKKYPNSFNERKAGLDGLSELTNRVLQQSFTLNDNYSGNS